MKRKSKTVPVGTKKVADAKTPMAFKDRQLMSVNPLKEQFEPTESEPIRQQARMAGY
jgi:hypothetical protein